MKRNKSSTWFFLLNILSLHVESIAATPPGEIYLDPEHMKQFMQKYGISYDTKETSTSNCFLCDNKKNYPKHRTSQKHAQSAHHVKKKQHVLY